MSTIFLPDPRKPGYVYVSPLDPACSPRKPQPKENPVTLFTPDPADVITVNPGADHLEQLVGYLDGLDHEQVASIVLGQVPTEAPQVAHWVPKTIDEADWAARKLAQLEAKRDEVKNYAAKVRDWERLELGKTDASVAFFEGHLERWALEQRRRTGSATLTIPSAVIKTTHRQARVAIGDKATIAAWARTRFDPDLYPDDPEQAEHAAEMLAAVVRVKEDVLVSDLRSVVSLDRIPTGLVVMSLSCGCTLTAEPSDGGSVECPEHNAVAVLKREVQVVLCVCFEGEPVPGAVVEPEVTTASVTLVR